MRCNPQLTRLKRLLEKPKKPRLWRNNVLPINSKKLLQRKKPPLPDKPLLMRQPSKHGKSKPKPLN
jgi:hypothetical protein